MSTMHGRSAVVPGLVLALAACGGGSNTGQSLVAVQIALHGATGLTTKPGAALTPPLTILVTDANGTPVPDFTVGWSVIDGGGSVDPAVSNTNSSGVASAQFTAGPNTGDQHVQAMATGLAGSPAIFTVHVTDLAVTLRVLSGGNNVPERFSSDLWVHGNYAYTGTWGIRNNQVGNVLKVWSLDASGAPALASSVTIADVGTVSDLQVSDDGQILVLSAEQRERGGIYTYSLSDPAHPAFLDSALVEVGSPGVHTVTLATIGGHNYAFAARNPGYAAGRLIVDPALVIYDLTQPSDIARVAVVPLPANYGIHDTYVRDGVAFVFAWDEGVIIYDVGNGVRGGSPSSPVEISRLRTAAGDVGSPAVHNGWWFHNPVTGETRYLFIGQEGPAVLGSQASGDIHVVDVFDLAHPREVAFFHLDGAGTHNFWMDESRQILYAAYYNAGVVALDVSGTLSGDLSGRLLSQIELGGVRNTFTWGVQLANGWLYASDMFSGLWQLAIE
jgi:hypothetical protein